MLVLATINIIILSWTLMVLNLVVVSVYRGGQSLWGLS